ncbi:MAG TPA: hypothetical protein DCS24_09905 [Erythrobacter sp.]|nr:hypothetical protein [Erythrobacter sp.]
MKGRELRWPWVGGGRDRDSYAQAPELGTSQETNVWPGAAIRRARAAIAKHSVKVKRLRVRIPALVNEFPLKPLINRLSQRFARTRQY